VKRFKTNTRYQIPITSKLSIAQLGFYSKYSHIGRILFAYILRYIHQNPSFNWTQDFLKFPAEEKANFWARKYGAVALWNTGRLRIYYSLVLHCGEAHCTIDGFLI